MFKFLLKYPRYLIIDNYKEKIRYFKNINDIINEYDHIKKPIMLPYTCKIISRLIRQQKLNQYKPIIKFIHQNLQNLQQNHSDQQCIDIFRLILQLTSISQFNITYYQSTLNKLLNYYLNQYVTANYQHISHIIVAIIISIKIQSESLSKLQQHLIRILQQPNIIISSFIIIKIQQYILLKISINNLIKIQIINQLYIQTIIKNKIIDTADNEHLIIIFQQFQKIRSLIKSKNSQLENSLTQIIEGNINSNYQYLTIKDIIYIVDILLQYNKQSDVLKKIFQTISKLVDNQGNCKTNPALFLLIITKISQDNVSLFNKYFSQWQSKFENILNKYFLNNQWKILQIYQSLEKVNQEKIVNQNIKKLVDKVIQKKKNIKSTKIRDIPMFS